MVKDEFQKKFKETCEFLKRLTDEDYAKYGYERQEVNKITDTLYEQTKDLFLNAGVVKNFPGANSISFDYSNMQTIQSRKTVVCEKTDGVRFFLCEVAEFRKGVQHESIWLLIDREYNFRRVIPNFDIQTHDACQKPQKEQHIQLKNVIDGELVIDNKWRKGT